MEKKKISAAELQLKIKNSILKGEKGFALEKIILVDSWDVDFKEIRFNEIGHKLAEVSFFTCQIESLKTGTSGNLSLYLVDSNLISCGLFQFSRRFKVVNSEIEYSFNSSK